MDLLRIAARVASVRTSGALEVFEHLRGMKPDDAVHAAMVRSPLEDDEAMEAALSVVEKFYGRDMSDDIRGAAKANGANDPLFVLHEVMHKVADPDFIFDIRADRQTPRSPAEAVLDEAIIAHMTKGDGAEDQTAGMVQTLLNAYSNTDEMLEDFLRPASDPAKSKLLSNAAKKFSRSGYDPDSPEYEDEEGERDRYVEGLDQKGDLSYAAHWMVSYFWERMDSFVRDSLEPRAEAEFKKFLSLLISRLESGRK